MNLFKLFTNPNFRIKTAHIIVIIILIVNSILFTHDFISIAIQLLLAFVILLHHIDDEILKKRLHNSQDKLIEDQSIFDKNVIVSETDIDGIITYVNKNYCRVTGYTKEELIGSSHSKIKSGSTSQELYLKLWNLISSGETFTGVFKNKKKDGSYFWVDTHIAPIISYKQIIGYKAIMFDITDKILAQSDLSNTIKEQVNRFEFVINSSRDGFWDYDLLKKDFYLSDGWRKRLGFGTTQKLSYLDYLSLIPQEHRFEHHTAMHDMLEIYPKQLEYVHFRIQYPLITKDSERLIIEDVGNIFFDKDRNPIRITGFHRDITEQERHMKIIESQNRIAAMGDMMSNVAHQWRQPIGAINNTLNDIEFDIELDDLQSIDSKVFLQTSAKVKEYTAYLSQTISDFNEQISDDKHKSNFNILHTIQEAYKITQNEYEKNQIHFNLVEGGEGESDLLGYARELQQVLINILNNAKDILIQNKIENPTVTVTIINMQELVKIIIHDNGGGIPEDIIGKIFDPYFTTKHESLGTGIGLYMSKNIITKYFQGYFEVENEDNGAKFIITLPKETNA